MDRSERIGRWVSGVGHAALIGWAALGGALFRPQPAPPIQMTEVATMTEAEFQDFAAASRGAGPVQGDQQEVAALPQPADEDVQSGALDAATPPDAPADAQELPQSPAQENAPDLTDLAATGAPVAVATELPQVAQSDTQIAALPPAPAQPSRPEIAQPQPEVLQNPAQADTAAQQPAQPAPPPRSALALDASARPRGRPDGLVEGRNQRLAAAAEAARRAADAQRQAQEEAQRRAEAEAEAEAQAERDRVAAEAEAEAQARARAEAEAARAAEEAATRAAEQAQREEEERLAAEAEQQERDRQAAAEAEAEAERQRQEEERLAAETAERERQQREAAEAEQAERDRIAAEEAEAAAEAERARQEAAAAEQAVRDAEAAAEVARQRAEEAAPDQDALTAALTEALGDGAPADGGGGTTSGPPLSLSEREGFRVAIEECWRVGTLSREAQATSVTVAFSMSPDGMPEPATFRLMGHSGGSPASAQQAYDFARRAVIACTGTGYALPAEKYDRWKEIIIDFRPDGVGVQ